MSAKKIGKIHKAGTMFLRQHVGEAETGKLKYEMSANIGGLTPIVKSLKTGKYFTLSWPQIMDLAQQAGIDTP